MIWLTASRPLIVLTYAAASAPGLALLPVVAVHAGPVALSLLLSGAVLYACGGIVYIRRRPNPAPSTFGHHEVFHLLTIAAAATHCASIVVIIHGIG